MLEPVAQNRPTMSVRGADRDKLALCTAPSNASLRIFTRNGSPTALDSMFSAAGYGREDDGAGAALELVALGSRRHSIVATLSGGMRTRCSLACAVVHKPRLLVLDEPTVGIDPQLRAEIWGKLGEMAADGVTVVVSSHVMDEAERCQRLCLMRAGRILAEGTVAELKKLAGVERLEDAFLRLSAVAAA